MPTRIVLSETMAVASPSSRPISTQGTSLTTARPRPSFSSHLQDLESPKSAITTPVKSNNPPSDHDAAGSPTNVIRPNHPNTAPRSSRKVVSLRSSLFPAIKEDTVERRLSREDIRASPRLLGYIFQLLASTVMLISVLKFYFQDEGNSETTPAVWSLFKNEREGESLRDDLFITLAGPVFTWKLIGCFVVAGLGTIINLFVILAHFDTVVVPWLWLRIFRDGSRYEQVIVIAMVFFWAGGIHINTSPLSVGESNPNTYITTWVSFFAAFLNAGVWRVSAGRISIAEYVNNHHRTTTYNWLWTFMFACTSAGALTSTYLNRQYVSLYFDGQTLELTKQQWITALAILWGLTVVCCTAILLNHFLKKSCEVRVCNNGIVLIGWRQAEGLISLGLAGFYFWFVYTYTGVDGFINGLNNLYFGSWGAFINSILLLSAWFSENKNIAFVIQEEEEREERMKSPRGSPPRGSP
ncbi:hypothetical protein IV203_033892 [Nitzschia inconspicua]|uniref:Uncharacterized protein n=1 Tax=Nitzschia inconspicua TaxID=303405 RepID=A0A9K3Q6U7_9STRA|nr:hypothetical protein IV203_033892 [Nitzschia inconspicua]